MQAVRLWLVQGNGCARSARATSSPSTAATGSESSVGADPGLSGGFLSRRDIDLQWAGRRRRPHGPARANPSRGVAVNPPLWAPQRGLDERRRTGLLMTVLSTSLGTGSVDPAGAFGSALRSQPEPKARYRISALCFHLSRCRWVIRTAPQRTAEAGRGLLQRGCAACLDAVTASPWGDQPMTVAPGLLRAGPSSRARRPVRAE